MQGLDADNGGARRDADRAYAVVAGGDDAGHVSGVGESVRILILVDANPSTSEIEHPTSTLPARSM